MNATACLQSFVVAGLRVQAAGVSQVNHYVSYYRDEGRPLQRKAWVEAGHDYYWYWSDDPFDPRRLSPSWIEW